jgi:DNA-binding NarL/FixJ family response regulator
MLMVSLAVELQLPAMQARAPVSQTGPMESRVQALRCVIVDDNPGFLDAAANFLGHQSITVVGMAGTIAEALSRIAELRPDVTVVDINLGGESGFDLADRLAGGPVSSPVILTSTHSEQEFAEMIAASSALGFVPKAELSADAIRRLLSRNQSVKGDV